MAMRSVNPASGELVREYEETPPAEVETRLARAEEAFAAWRRTSMEERTAMLRRVAAALRDRKDEHARLMTLEMGKPIAQAEAEVEKCAWVCDFYADNAAAFLAPESRESGARESFVRFDPLGPVLAIMPWNFPYWQVLRFAAPCLAAGNVALLKHAPNVTGCALAIEELFAGVGCPEGVFQTLVLSEARTAPVIEDPRVRAVSLTGSDRAGSAVGALAGRALKTVVLELGGSDPFVVLADADLDRALEGAVIGRTLNSGQSCIAAKRFLVHASLTEELARRLAERLAALRVGDPADRATDIGPLAREDLRENLDRQVRESLAKGARSLCGGRPLGGPGCFYPPTVLVDVRPGMPAADEETFGPVAAVLSFRDEEEAVRLANATPYGLGASLWTRDPERAKRLVPRIDAGSVFVNDFVKSDPRLPFGGVKRSGHGRELGREGILEFVNVKTVWVARAERVVAGRVCYRVRPFPEGRPRMSQPVDLRSDTVTRPDPAMRAAIAAAEVGDDVLEKDPTVGRLEARVAELLGKEAALFVPSGVMANQIAVRAHAAPGTEVIAESGSHVVHYEAGAAHALAGVGFFLVEGKRGVLDPAAVRAAIRPPVPHLPRTSLVWLENTHNTAGGSVWPLERLDAVGAVAREAGLPVHLDGARIWNAAVATGESPTRIAACADTVAVCMSKGLGAPVGSLIAGPAALMERCWVLRKQMGGGMRQSGLLAAAALYGLEHNLDGLAEDHANARLLAERLAAVPGVAVDLEATQTNIVIFDVTATGRDGIEVVAEAERRGVRLVPFGGGRVRAVTHRDVGREEVLRAADVLGDLLAGER